MDWVGRNLTYISKVHPVGVMGIEQENHGDLGQRAKGGNDRNWTGLTHILEEDTHALLKD